MGYVLSVKGINLSDASQYLTNTPDALQSESGSFSIVNTGTKYTLNWDLRNSDSESSDESDTSSYGDYFKQYDGYLNFTLTLPCAPISHNATEVSADGKTLTWDLLSLKEQSINAEFDLADAAGGGINMLPIIILGIVAVVVVLVIVILVVSSRNKKKQQEMQADEQMSEASQSGTDNDPAPTPETGKNENVETSEDIKTEENE